MKLRNRLFALVLSAALVLTCIPVLVFADEIPKSDPAQTEDQQADATTPETPQDEASQPEAVQPEDSQGETAQPQDDEQPSEDAAPQTDTEPQPDVAETGEPAAAYPEPIEISFMGADFTGIIGTTEVTGIELDTNTIEVIYNDGPDPDEPYIGSTHKEYIYGSYKYKAENGKTEYRDGFMLEGGDPSKEYSYAYVYYDDQSHVFKEGDNTITLRFIVPYIVKGDGSKDSDYEWKTINQKVNVFCNYDMPVAIRFIPAKNFVPNAFVGYNYINEQAFYGEGNVFEVDYKAKPVDPEYPNFGYTAEYKYVRQKTEDGIVEGFYDHGNINYDRLDLTEGTDCYLKKGSNKVTIPYTEYIPVLNKEVTLNFTYDINVSKLDAYANSPIFNYTGKAITKKAFAKKLVVRDSAGNKVPASAYTYSLKSNKKMGWYSFTINFKDKNKYVSSIIADYGIGPKAPVAYSPKAGKKKLTVRWKKFSKSQLKRIDGMYIELATDKNFTQNYKLVKISKKALKKGSKTVKKLKGGKKYYVRMYTFKKIKQDGESYGMISDFSKTRTKKVRK